MTRLAAAAAVLALAGCGGDDEKASETAPQAPELTVPQTETETTGSETETSETAPAPATGTTPAPAPAPTPQPDTGAGQGGTGTPPDSPQNDTPPPRGSPAEKFESFCKENPGACG